ncbi:MAG: sulfatase, partial [Planctomycetales bacterium]|nr:sulfatase [Planctomycetales bacterium]
MRTLLCFAPLALAAAAATAQADERPNIIFIFADDHAYQAISCYGSKVNETPNLDRIAKEGMRFTNCFVTNSLCGPARAVIQTGKYSHLNGFFQNGNRFNGDQQTFPKLLQKAGYATAVVGKWHLESTPQGYDYYHVLRGQGPYYNPPMLTSDGPVKHVGYTTDIITDVALDWLKNKRDPQKPFMLMFQHKAPHRNWQPGPDHLHTYDDVEIPEPETLFDDYAHRASPAHNQAMEIDRHMTMGSDLKLSTPGGLTDEQKAVWEAAYGPKNEKFKEQNLSGKDLVRWKYQRYMKDYLRCIASVDDNVGRVLKHLDDTGLAKNTVVIYSSDQGFYLGEHGWFDKRWMYEESLRTPLMVRWPGKIKPGSVRDEFVSNLDFAETFLTLAGVEVPADMQGASLQPLLSDAPAPKDWRTAFYYHYYEFPGAHSVARHCGVRTDRYKLIHYYELSEWELFDLEKDPQELHSVYDDPAYADTQADLLRQLAALQTKYKDDTAKPKAARKPKDVKREQAARFFADKPAKLAGKGPAVSRPSSPEFDPSQKPLAIGAHVAPVSPRGVIAAFGGESEGFSLYLFDGIPHFSVRSGGAMETAFGETAVSEKGAHVAAVLNAEGVAT